MSAIIAVTALLMRHDEADVIAMMALIFGCIELIVWFSFLEGKV